MSVGLKLLASLIDDEKGLDRYARLRLDDSMFMGEAEIEAFKYVSAHVLDYSKLPSRQTLKESGILNLPVKAPEPPKYYFDRLRERYVFYQLKGMLSHVEGHLNDDKPSHALETMAGTMSLCQLFMQRDRLFDFTQDGLGMVLGEFRRKLRHGDDHGLKMGWPTLDTMTGGLSGGDLITVVGRPGAGKTYLMMHAANTAWANGRVPLFVSMEMKPLLVMQRATAMMAHLPITGVKHAALATLQQQRMQKTLSKLKKSTFPYWIVDGALTATVNDVLLMARQLNPGVIFIDGAYLLRGATKILSRWERLTENAERMKSDLAEALDIPVVVSYQFNREVKKGMKAENVGLDNIAYTDALGQLSSVVLGMLQEESVETLIRRRIEVLKGRSGEQGHFNINWRFDEGPDYMNFTEILPPKEDTNQPPPYLDYL